MSNKQDLYLLKIVCVVSFIFSLLAIGISITSITMSNTPNEIVETTTYAEETTIEKTENITETVVEEETEVTKPADTPTIKPVVMTSTGDKNLTEEEVELIARVTYAEAGICSDYCQRLVIDAILNQVDNEKYPNTISGVIYKKGNFDVIANGSAYKYALSEDTLRLVREEIKSRTNNEVLYFRTDYYHKFGTPVTYVDNVYFSK